MSEVYYSMYHFQLNEKLNEFERTLAEMFLRTHKCPWHKRLFKKKHDDKYLFVKEASSGIGIGYSIICRDCRETIDITDYNAW